MFRSSLRHTLLVGSLVVLIVTSSAGPASAATEAVTGTATTSGGNGFTTQDFAYSSPGVLGSGTLHFDFAFAGSTTTGTGVLTRSDGATLIGTETSTVDGGTFPFPVAITFTVSSGTGALAGLTGQILLTGSSGGPGVVGDVFTMTGAVETPTPVPTSKDQCKHGGWQHLADEHGEPFANQGRCVTYAATNV